MNEAIINQAFEKFEPLDPELIKALQQAKRFVHEMCSANSPARWITFLGDSGCGKTMLARCINFIFRRYFDMYIDENHSGPGKVFYRKGGFKNWTEVVGDFLSGDYSGLRDLKSDWFVVLDDIGAEYGRNRELATAKLYEVLNARLGKWTVITANIKLEAISELDVRLSSRLIRDGSIVVNVDAPDYNSRVDTCKR